MDELTACGSEAMPYSDHKEDEPPPGLRLEVVHDSGDWNGLEPFAPVLERLASEFTRELRLEIPSLAVIALSSDARVRSLNKNYRDKDRSTNVLSFPAARRDRTASATAAFLGDVVLAGETVLGEAREGGVPARHHAQHLIVHGLLHLLGYDHADDQQACAMEALEIRILARLGIPDPYAAADLAARA